MIPSLAALAELIGDPQVRNRGTIGGSISNNDPAADYPGALLALGATVRTNKREIPADDFFTGMFETALAPRRDRHRGALPEAGEGRLRQVPEPGQPLLDGRRVRGADRRRRCGSRSPAPARRAFRWTDAENGAGRRTSRPPRSTG